MPDVKVFNRPQPARIMQSSAELAEPWPRAIGDSIQRPDADLSIALHAILPAVLFFQSNPKQTNHRFAPKHSTKFLGRLSISPRRHHSMPRLSISYQHGHMLSKFLCLQRTHGPAAVIWNHTRIRIDLPRLEVPELPQIEQPLLPPENVCLSRRVLRIV